MPNPVRLLLVAHNCSPSGGSEARVSFQVAEHLGKAGVRVTVLSNGVDLNSPIDPNSVPTHPNVEFISVNVHQTPGRLPVPPYIMVRYQTWLLRALKRARELHAVEPFDVVHHLSWTSLIQGSPFHRLGPPFVMGPVGGGVKTPEAYLDEFVNRKSEKFRNAMVDIMGFTPFTRSVVSNAALIIASNPETAAILKKMGVAGVQCRYDDAIGDSELRDTPIEQSTDGPLRVLWMSRILERKALRMALAAIERANETTPVVMTLIGDGPDRERNANEIGGLEAKGFLVDLGWQDQEAIEAAYENNDVLLYNSLRDNGSAPLHTASRFGMPAVVLNHHGPGFITNDQWAIRLPLSNPEQSVEDLAQAMVDLAGDPSRRINMGQAALEASHNNRWSDWAQYLDDLYQDLRDRDLRASA